MRKFSFSQFFILIVLSLASLASLIFFIFRNDDYRSALARPINQVVSPISAVMTKPIAYLSSFVSDVFSIDEIRAENIALREQLSDSASSEAIISNLEDENSSLKATLSVQETFSSVNVLTTKVLKHSSTTWLDNLTIDAGSQSGVSENMLVLSNGFLLGVVSEVGALSSEVLLLTNSGANLNLPVKFSLSSGDIYGILTHYDVEKGAFVVSKLNAKGDIASGSLVYTSGLDGQTVANVSVGTVQETTAVSDVSQVIYVVPSADFDNVSYVNLIGKSNE